MKAAKATLRVSRAAPKPRPSAAAVVPANITVGCRVAVRVVEGEDPLPGVVLFIGETKFAEGPWLGIELDEPKGKNNGKVQDVVYFTCRPNHGIFVRAAKVLKLEEQPKSNAQEASPANADASQFAVGARVLVRTLENVQGTVRFNGSTQFAEGEWLGVELDQPQGKNDGTVRGVAYFSCPPLHGLFARPGNLVLDQSAASSTSPTTTPQSAAETLQEAQDPGFPGESTREASKAEPLAVKAPQDVLPQISKELKEQFLSEVQQFEEWRTAPRCLGNRELTGWGAFLKEQRALPREGEVSLRQVAEAAAERWRELGAEEKERYRLQAETAVRRGATYRPKAMAGGAFASAVYGETKLKAKTRDAPEAQDLDKKERKKAEKKRSPEATASLAQLREERWASQGPDSTVPVFLWELEEHKVDKALSGDLHLPSPETDKVGHLDPDITRFTRMKTMKGLEVLLLSFNEATQACKVVYPSRDENRVGWVSLLELRFLAPVEDFEPLAVELEDEDFFPPEVGDLHRVHRAGGKDQYAVKEVWEDEDTGFYHWTYGDKLIDSQAHATCCSAHGKFLIPFRRLPKVDIEQMKRDEVAKRETRKSRKTPESWSDLPLLWRMMQAGKAHLEVANPGAAISELAALTGKKRGGKRNAVAALPNAVRKRRQQVEVKCTAEAFLCQPGSRFGLLSQNALGLSCIMRCVTAVELLTDGSGKVKVKTDNCEEESTIDPTPSQAMKFPQLEYEGGTELTVLLADGRLVNGTVTRNERWNRYAITAQGEEELVDLNEANHVKGHMANFDVELYREYCTAQRDRYRFLEDSITCQKMDVETQVIYIDTAVENAKVSTPDIKSLATMLLDSDGERYLGQQLAYRCLMVAGPGTGKTWSSCQLMYHLSKACTANADTRGLVKMPVLLFVQKMAGMMRTEGVTDKAYAEMSLAAKDDVLNKPWLEEAFKTEYNAKYGEALMRALRLRAAVVILDGIDEASDVKGVMQDYILRRLVPMQICLVVTSRPEGVSAALKSLRKSFAVMSLKPLSDEQQKQIILNQVQKEGNEFFEKLLKFAEIRAKHDNIYYNQAFSNPEDRRFMEKKLPATNRFKREDGSWDRKKLQHTLSGEVIQPAGDQLTAKYLQNASAYFTEELFGEMDRMLADQQPTAELGKLVKEKFPGTEAFPSGPSLAQKLYELAEKKKDTHQSLWSKVVSATDQLLAVAEHFKPLFEKTVDALCINVKKQLQRDKEKMEKKPPAEELQLPTVACESEEQEGQKEQKEQGEQKEPEEESDEYELIIGPLKDPVRIHEKAADDYADRFPELLPEANVVDVIRARLVCSSGTQMKTFLEKIAKGFKTEIDGQEAKLTLARSKNKFSSKDSDPSRFRNVLLNLELTSNSVSHFVELQVHHKLILDYNEVSHAHDYYDFFRRELANQYGKEMETSLNFMLEERMLLFKEISEVPVLLSVMTMALLHSRNMPSNLNELYDMGLRNMLMSRLGEASEDEDRTWHIMKLIALQNHFNSKRIFTAKDVEEALRAEPELLPLFRRFVDDADVPFVKILADGEDAEFQFRHLSFQEALVAKVLGENDARAAEAAQMLKQQHGSFAEFLNNPFMRNMLRIGAGQVGDAFGKYWALTSPLTDDGVAGLWNLLLGARKLILVSFLHGHNEDKFPPKCDDWYQSLFTFSKPQGKGTVMYSLSKVNSQVKNLQSALVTYEACHILFRGGIDTSAFEAPSTSFPALWSGKCQALDISKAPTRVVQQLAFNWKNCLVHFQETERDFLEAPKLKWEIAHRVPELHRLSGPRWVFVSKKPQEPFSFNPCECVQVFPVYLAGSCCSFIQSPPFMKHVKPPNEGVADALCLEKKTAPAESVYQASFKPGFEDLFAVSEVVAGKRLQLAPDPRTAEHYARVFKAFRGSQARQHVVLRFASRMAAFRTWREACKKAETETVADGAGEAAEAEAVVPEAPEAAPMPMEAEVTGDDNEASEAMPADEEPVREAKHYEDTGGNAEVFRPRNAAKGLTWLKCMWSRAWNAQGERLSDFQHALQEMPPPVLEEVAPRSLRRWLLRGGKWDFSLKPWPQLDTHVVASDAVLPKAKEAKEAKPKAKAKAKTKKDKEAEDKKATSSWEATLAGARGIENPLAGKEQQWSTDFTAIVPLDADVIKHDCILESQAPDIRCLRGHKLLRKVVDDDGSDDSDDEGAQCSRCYQPIKAKDSYYICEPMADETKDTFCDERVMCSKCHANAQKAYWKAHTQDASAESRQKDMRAALMGFANHEELRKVVSTTRQMGGHCPKNHKLQLYESDSVTCDKCGIANDGEGIFYGCKFHARECNYDQCEKCFKEGREAERKLRRKWRRNENRLIRRRPWNDDTAAVWNPLPDEVVLLDIPEKEQMRVAQRRQKRGKTWQQCFDLRAKRLRREGKRQLPMVFFTHRLEPEKAAGFVTKYRDLLKTEKEMFAEEEHMFADKDTKSQMVIRRNILTLRQKQVLLWRESGHRWARRLAAKLQCWRGTESTLHERTSLKGTISPEFFTHRLDNAERFLQKYGHALSLDVPKNAPEKGAAEPSQDAQEAVTEPTAPPQPNEAAVELKEAEPSQEAAAEASQEAAAEASQEPSQEPSQESSQHAA